MTNERKRAIIIVVVTLLAGILIGALGQAMLAKNYHRFGDRSRMEGRGQPDVRAKRRFAEKVYQVAEATEAQKLALKPILDRSMTRFDSLRAGFEASAKANLQALFVDMEGILEPGQIQELKTYFEKREGDRGRR
jgi:hypothetical protein